MTNEQIISEASGENPMQEYTLIAYFWNEDRQWPVTIWRHYSTREEAENRAHRLFDQFGGNVAFQVLDNQQRGDAPQLATP